MSLAAEKIGHNYGSVIALRNVTVEAAAGRITVVIGPNAAGKSTLLRCLIGTLRPTGGVALLDGRPAHGVPARQIARRVAYVPQRPLVAASFTVREVIELGRFALPPSSDRVNDALQRLDLGEIADRPFPALSVGQQQRATLARAVAQIEDDGHLVLDEPTSAMDLRHAHNCFALLRGLADRGATVVLALHDLTAAASLADDCWLLHAGELVANGPTAHVLQPERLRDVFGVPFEWIDRAEGARALLSAPPPPPPHR